jgi:DNA-binding CsgD family transcriptional regulator
MSAFRCFLSVIGFKRESSRLYALDEKLHLVLVTLAEKEQRPPEDVHADLIADALEQRNTYEALWECWQSLSPREQDVTALSCQGYTNRQIASRLHVSPDTVKGYVRQVLIKFRLHSKDELKMALQRWDFSQWGPKAQY